MPLGTVVQLLGLASQAQHRAVACDDHNKAGVPPKGATGAAAAAASSVVSSAEGRKIRTDAATVASDTCEEDEYSSEFCMYIRLSLVIFLCFTFISHLSRSHIQVTKAQAVMGTMRHVPPPKLGRKKHWRPSEQQDRINEGEGYVFVPAMSR